MYRQLDGTRILETIHRLQQRIRERFPNAALNRIAAELYSVANESMERVAFLGRPNVPLRILTGALILLIIAIGGGTVASLRFPAHIGDWGAFVQALEAGINDIVFVAVAIYFLATLESRLKRHRALAAIHKLRSIAHIVDMHQLTKDPEQVRSRGSATSSSPARALDRFELTRYLDYCSELLSLTSKVAAMHVQRFQDPVVLEAVNDMETMATGLSGKIWQKITILDTAIP